MSNQTTTTTHDDKAVIELQKKYIAELEKKLKRIENISMRKLKHGETVHEILNLIRMAIHA